MSSLIKTAAHFIKSEDGPTATEYAVMLALIVVACLAAVQMIGSAVDDSFAATAEALDEA